MIYDTKEQAQLEIQGCLKRNPDATWEIKQVEHIFWREKYPRRGYQPNLVSTVPVKDGQSQQAARRSMYHNT